MTSEPVFATVKLAIPCVKVSQWKTELKGEETNLKPVLENWVNNDISETKENLEKNTHNDLNNIRETKNVV